MPEASAQRAKHHVPLRAPASETSNCAAALKVATEMALHVLAYDLTCVMIIIGVKPLIAAMAV